MKNLGQTNKVLAILLIGAAVIGLMAWRFITPEFPQVTQTLPHAAQANTVQTNTNTAQVSTVQSSLVAAPAAAPATEPAVAALAESGKEAGEDLHDHDEQIEPPSQATIDAIREMKKPTADEGQTIQYPDGSTEIKLGNRFQSVPVATVGKDGKVHVDYHGEKYLQDEKKVEEKKPEQQKSEEKKSEAKIP